MPQSILIIEDEEALARFVELELTHEGYLVEKAFDGRDGLQKALEGSHDLILLDIMLPSLNGLEVLRRLRREKKTPVILLTARDAVMDKVTGLDMGADDYITKPFAIEELLARIRVSLRKHEKAPESDLKRLSEIVLDPLRHTVTVRGNDVSLTSREFQLLEYMMENEGIVLSRETLLSNVWGYDYMGETNVVDVYIRYLRQKIDEAYDLKTLHTVRGVGYVMKSE
ncbi:MAG: response regulator transcription factor [Clostridia bacterium]|nr:response regulator transcription factor [Clostridia bacterium]MBR6787178.1 response regulator transcription factor [Clostridia bacterium]